MALDVISAPCERSGNECEVCGGELGPRATRFCGRSCAGKARSLAAWTLVACANETCPRPQDLLRRRKDKLNLPGRERSYHPECKPKGGVQERNGKEAFCKLCRRSLGYRPLSWFTAGHQWCRTCSYNARRQTQAWVPKVVRRCARCGTDIERADYACNAWDHWFCSRSCHEEWRWGRRTAVPATCRRCGKTTTSSSRTHYASYDPASGTYLCQRCYRPPSPRRRCARRGCNNEVVVWPSHPQRYCSRECADAVRRARRKRVVCRNPDCRKNYGGPVVMELPVARANRRRFCSRQCAVAWLRRYRAKLVCPNCTGTFDVPRGERDRRKFCSDACRRQYRLKSGGRPDALATNERVLAAWEAGVRGPKHLAAAARTSLRVIYRVRHQYRISLGSDA